MPSNISGPGVSRPNHTYTSDFSVRAQTVDTSNVPDEVLQWAENDAVPYVTNLQNMLAGRMPAGEAPLTSEERAAALRNIATVMDELRQYNLESLIEWDPLTGNTGPVEGTPSATPLGRNARPDHEDANQWVYDNSVRDNFGDTNTFAFQATADKRSVVSYFDKNELNFPSSSDQITVSRESDPVSQVVVTRKLRDGSTQRYVFPNADRSGFKLNIHVGSADQVTYARDLPSGIKSKIKTKVEGDENIERAPRGTPPTSTESETHIWDARRADIYPSDMEGSISVSDQLTLHTDSNREYVFVSWDATSNQYIYKVCNTNNENDVKWTAKIDDFRNLKITLDVDPDHIIWQGDLRNEDNVQRMKFQTAGDETPATRAADRELTPHDGNVTTIAGQPTKSWNTQDEVTIRAGLDSNSNIVYQVDADALTLRSDNRSQFAVVTKNSDGNYTITVHSGTPATDANRVRTVNARQLQNLNLEGFAASNVTYKSTPGATPTAWTAGMDDKIRVGRAGAEEPAAPTVQGDSNFRPGPNGSRTWENASASTTVNIYSRNDNKINNITSRGAVQLHPTSVNEYWSVSFEHGKYVVRTYDAAPTGTPPAFDPAHLKETFNIDPMAPSIKFDIDPSHITFVDDLGSPANSNRISTDPNGRKLSFLGTTGPDGAPTVDPRTGTSALPGGLNGLLNMIAPRPTQEQLIEKLNAFGITNLSALEEAFNSGNFPPRFPDARVINFLKSLDPVLSQAMDRMSQVGRTSYIRGYYTDDEGNGSMRRQPAGSAEFLSAQRVVMDRLNTLLNQLYSGKGAFTTKLNAPNRENPHISNQLVFTPTGGQPVTMNVFRIRGAANIDAVEDHGDVFDDAYGDNRADDRYAATYSNGSAGEIDMTGS